MNEKDSVKFHVMTYMMNQTQRDFINEFIRLIDSGNIYDKPDYNFSSHDTASSELMECMFLLRYLGYIDKNHAIFKN